MKILKLTKEDINEYQQIRDPYILIDGADEVIPGVSAKGYKDLKKDEWFFIAHWPGDPNMPGMLQVETLVQMCALSIQSLPGNKGKGVYLVSADKMKFLKKITPGVRLNISTRITSWKRGIGKCYGEIKIDKDLACKANFTVVLPSTYNKFALKKII